MDSQEDYGYGGPWPDYDMNYGPPHKTRHEAPRDNEEEMLSSMGLPTSFTASIDQSMENFAEDIPLEAKGRNAQGGKCSTWVYVVQDYLIQLLSDLFIFENWIYARYGISTLPEIVKIVFWLKKKIILVLKVNF